MDFFEEWGRKSFSLEFAPEPKKTASFSKKCSPVQFIGYFKKERPWLVWEK